MALALQLDTVAPAANPRLVLTVPSPTAPIIDNEETAAPAKPLPLRTTTPPKLNETTPASTSDSNDPMQALIVMMAVLIAMEVLVGNIMAKDGGLQDKMNSNTLKALQAKQVADTKKIDEEAEEASKAGIFQKIAIAFECAVAVLTFPFDPVGSIMMMAGAILQTLEMTGTVPQQWSDSAIKSFFAKMAVVFVLSAGGNIVAGAEKGVAETSEETGEEAAEQASAQGTKSGRFNYMVGAQALTSLNPLSDLANCAGNDKMKEIFSIVATVVTAILAFMAAYTGASTASDPFNLPQSQMSKLNLLRTACGAVETGANVGTGVFSYKEGVAVQAQGKEQKEISVLSALSQIVQTQTQNVNDWQSQVTSQFAAINKSFDQLTYAEAQAASVLQG